jgi:hypothetical protein
LLSVCIVNAAVPGAVLRFHGLPLVRFNVVICRLFRSQGRSAAVFRQFANSSNAG